ncbi:hypothetical protein R3I94_021781 [Phoxinus phoxinus]
MLLKVGLSNTLFWNANQWIVIHMFHCRMVISYYMWWVSWNHWEEMNTHIPLVQRLLFFIGLFLLTFFISPMWTHKRTLQLSCNPVDWNFDNMPPPENGPIQDQAHKPHAC